MARRENWGALDFESAPREKITPREIAREKVLARLFAETKASFAADPFGFMAAGLDLVLFFNGFDETLITKSAGIDAEITVETEDGKRTETLQTVMEWLGSDAAEYRENRGIKAEVDAELGISEEKSEKPIKTEKPAEIQQGYLHRQNAKKISRYGGGLYKDTRWEHFSKIKSLVWDLEEEGYNCYYILKWAAENNYTTFFYNKEEGEITFSDNDDYVAAEKRIVKKRFSVAKETVALPTETDELEIL